MDDPFNLKRFVSAQERCYEDVVSELRRGQKVSHWMWFVFPQIAGLGSSPTSRLFEISSIDEAKAYRGHAVLGPRLIECTEIVNQIDGRSASQIFPDPDDLKFRSSMTLFSRALPLVECFAEALRKYFDGTEDPRTLTLLRR